ncbi:MAG: hypothetical protein R3D57_09735 [Hyphomicrobiaceae bacterium]
MRALGILLASLVTLSAAASAEEPVGPPSGTASVAAPAADVDLPETVVERNRLMDELYERLRQSKDAETSARIETVLQRLWVYSGSDTADLLLTRSSVAIEGKSPEVAREILDALIGLEPGYAEAWNRRAYLNYSEQNFQAALSDLSHALLIEPRHFKALEGWRRS